MTDIIDSENSYIFPCPHCGHLTQVLKTQINCQIFRHGSYFRTLPFTSNTYTYEFRQHCINILINHLNQRTPDIIMGYVGELPQYIPTEPINPHMPKHQCDQLVLEGKVLGCAKPFRFSGNSVDKCDYI